MALLEEKLSQGQQWVVLDRQHIQKVIQEHSLIAKLGSPTAQERRDLGKLLNADVLLIGNFNEQPQPHLDLTLTETQWGYTLGHFYIPQTLPGKQEILSIVPELDLTLAKLVSPQRLVCAVPAFTNRDLTRQYDHLQNAYARMLESLLLQMPGVIVVETAEARAIAQEMMLSGRERIDRDMPLYVLGEFRYDANTAAVVPYVEIALYRGDEMIAQERRENVTPEGTPEFLRGGLIKMFDSLTGKHSSGLEPGAEAAILVNRARTLFSVGQYKEAAQLMEASFLLQPDQFELRLLAMTAYGRLAESASKVERIEQHCGKPVEDSLEFAELALEHLEYYLIKNKAFSNDASVYNGISGAIREYTDGDACAELRPKIFEHRRKTRDAYRRVIEEHAAAGDLSDELLEMILGRALASPEYYDETLSDNIQVRQRLLPLVLSPTIKYPERYVTDLVDYGMHPTLQARPEYKAFLEELTRYDRPVVQDVAKQFLQKLQNRPAPYQYSEKPRQEPISKTPLDLDVVFDPVEFFYQPPEEAPRRIRVIGVQACGQKTDLVWGWDAGSGNRQAFLMKEKGVLIKIFDSDLEHDFGQAACNDELAWLPVTGSEPYVLAIDLKNNTVESFTMKDGLPPMHMVSSVLVGSRRVCLAASFGLYSDLRSFIAVLELKDDRTHSVRIIHEAKRALSPDRPEAEQIREADLVFLPGEMVSEFKSGRWLVALSRQSNYPGLLIDVDAPRVQVMNTFIDSHVIGDLGEKEHTLYWVSAGRARDSYVIKAFNADTDRETVLGAAPEDGKMMFYENQAHLVGKHWWIAKDAAGPFQKLKADVPGEKPFLHKCFISHHYGLLFTTSVMGDWKFFQVSFPERKSGQNFLSNFFQGKAN